MLAEATNCRLCTQAITALVSGCSRPVGTMLGFLMGSGKSRFRLTSLLQGTWGGWGGVKLQPYQLVRHESSWHRRCGSGILVQLAALARPQQGQAVSSSHVCGIAWRVPRQPPSSRILVGLVGVAIRVHGGHEPQVHA